MKMLAKPIDVVAVFLNREKPKPCRIRFRNEEGEDQVIRVEKVLSVTEKRLPGARTYIYACQSTKGMDAIRFELMYKPDSDSWLLYKM